MLLLMMMTMRRVRDDDGEEGDGVEGWEDVVGTVRGSQMEYLHSRKIQEVVGCGWEETDKRAGYGGVT